MKDYYSILGVSRNATDAEVKKAYRKLARELHPDVAGSDSADEERFKDVQNAYEVLSNAEKRQLYDNGIDPLSPNASASANPFGAGFNFDFSNLNDIFDMFGGHASGGFAGSRGSKPSNRGKDVLKRLKITLAEAVFGTEKTLSIDLSVNCDTCDGSGSKTKQPPQTCPTCQGHGVVISVQRSMFGQIQQQSTCPQCRGGGVVIADPCTSCGGQGIMVSRKKVDVTIPKGVHPGNRIIFEGKGNKGPLGGASGDLYIEIAVRDHEVFSVNGSDLVCKLEVPLTAALLGTTVEIDTLDGKESLEIPAGTSFGTTLILDDLGIPTAVRSDVRGKLKVFIEVLFPTKLNNKEKELVLSLSQQLKDGKHKYSLENIENGGFFSKLKKVFS